MLVLLVVVVMVIVVVVVVVLVVSGNNNNNNNNNNSGGVVVVVTAGTYAICAAPPSDTSAHKPPNLPPCFAAFSYFLPNGPLPGLLRSSSPSGSLRIPAQSFVLNGFIPFLRL